MIQARQIHIIHVQGNIFELKASSEDNRMIIQLNSDQLVLLMRQITEIVWYHFDLVPRR